MSFKSELPEKVMDPENKCNINPSTHPELKLADTRWCSRLKQCTKEAWGFRSKITVEPFVICYIMPSVLAGLAVQNLCLEKSCLVNLNYDHTTCKHIMRQETSNFTKQAENVNTLVATMTGWSYPLQTALPGILALFLGSWSDRTGNRKLFMMLPIFGKFTSSVGLILSLVFFYKIRLNETALIEGLPPALAGGRVSVNMAVYSYITDITSESERTFRLGIITALLTLCRPIGLALSGYMLKQFGYYTIFSVACIFYLTGFIYVALMVKTRTKKSVECQKSEKCVSIFQIGDLVATVNVLFKKREHLRRLQIYLVIIAYMLIVGPVLGEAQMTYWFARHKFAFTEVDLSFFQTYSTIIGIIGSILTVYLLSKRCKIDDSIIGVIACVSRITASIVYALAPTRTVYFLGPIMDLFSSGGATSLRSMATKLVHNDETGKTNSLISISEAMVSVVYAPIYSKVYLSTREQFPGAFYLISAMLAIPAIVILISLYILRKREDGEHTTGEEMSQVNDINT